MAGKQLCSLVSVSVLIALGLVAIVLGEAPGDRTAEAGPASFAPDESVATAAPVPAAAVLENLPLNSGRRPATPENLVVDDTIIAEPILPGYGTGDSEYERLGRRFQ